MLRHGSSGNAPSSPVSEDGEVELLEARERQLID
jgi:hypothetical protein